MQRHLPMATDFHVVNDPVIFTLVSPAPIINRHIDGFLDKDPIGGNEIDQLAANKFSNA